MFLFSGRNEKPGVKVEETSFITAAFKSTWFYFHHKYVCTWFTCKVCFYYTSQSKYARTPITGEGL